MLQFLKTIGYFLAASARFSLYRWLILAFFTCSYFVSFAQTGIIIGKVKDGEIALQGTSITIEESNNLTNSAGEFFIHVKPGTHTLTISHVGYKKLVQAVTIHTGETQFRAFNMIRDDELGEVVVLGSRSFIQRSNLNTAVPVDVIGSKELKQTHQFSLIQMLNFTAPSLH